MPWETSQAKLVGQLRREGRAGERVLQVIARVPRDMFVPELQRHLAFADEALSIGWEQTISQPFVVARMIEALRGEAPLGKVLEIGTGCGYQAALLARLATEVYSVERIAGLLEKARGNLRPLRLSNLRLVHADGTQGLPEAAPFDESVAWRPPSPWCR